MHEILELAGKIWDLPWYKVICIALIDDVLVFAKLWPLWVILFALTIFAAICNR